LSIVGKDMPFTIYDDERVKPYLDAIEGDTRAAAPNEDRPSSDIPGDDDDQPPRPPVEPRPTVNMESMEH
jgi:hypothetical protein